MAWSTAFDDPVALPDGRILRTLRDAGRHIAGLPKATQARPEWQTATEALIMAAEDRAPMLHARVGMLRAMNAGKLAPAVEPRRKRAKAFRILR